MSTLFQDLRYGVRILLKQPAFTLVAVITLALGIGANTAIFSLVNSILLRPLPFREPDRVVRLIQASPKLGLDTWGVSQADFAAYREQNRSLESIALFNSSATNLTGEGEPERLPLTSVTADFFKVLGVNPVLGRTFVEGEDAEGKNLVCVISHRFWQRRFAGDPNIVGKKLSLNNIPTQVVGVMPAEFKFPRLEIDLWVPMPLDTKRTAPYFFTVIGRMKPGTQVAQVQSDTTGILQNFGWQHPKNAEFAGLQEGNGPRTIVKPIKEVLLGKTEKPLLVLLAAVALVLLIACANVANLLLARATSRTREIAVRVSLGASPRRVARQLLTESVLLSFVGAVVGVGLAAFGIRMLDKLPISGIVRMEEVNLSWTVLAFTAALTVFTGLLFGFMPALRAYAMGIATGIREGVRGTASHRRLNSALVAVQFALSLVLLIGAGLLLKSFQKLESVDLGFNAENTLTMVATLPRTKYDNEEKALNFYNSALERLRNSPGIRQVGLTNNLPFGDGGEVDGFIVEGQEPPPGETMQIEQAELQSVIPGTFRTLEIPLLQGRDFQSSDHANSTPVAIIDETLSRRYWPANDAVGRRIQTSGNGVWLTIVGVVGGIKHTSLSEEKEPHIYFPFAQSPDPRASFVVRTDGPPNAATGTFRAAIRQVDPDIPLYLVRSMTEIIAQTLSTQRLTNILLTAFAVIALLLAAVGIYSTMSVYVGSRTKEFGIRLALGAQPSVLRRAVLRQGLLLTAAGVVVGVAGALALTRTIKSLLFEVSTTDPLVFTAIPALLVVVSVFACYTPARRATKVDPLVALQGGVKFYRVLTMYASLKQNVGFALRTLFKNKGFTITAVLTLALGIGATTAIFSVVYAVFEPMPYPKPDQLVIVWSWSRGARSSVPSGDFLEWQRRTTSFQGIGAWSGATFNVATNDRPQEVDGSRRTPGFFTFEGLPFLLGRDFRPEEAEPGKDHVVILSHRLWSTHFNSNRDLVGKDIRMNGESYTVIGVLPPGIYDRFNSQFWVPLSFRPEQISHDSNNVLVMARLKDDVSLGQAQAEMEGIAGQLQGEFPRTNANRGVSVQPLHLNFVTDSTRRNLWLLLGAVGFLLLIGCVNVANLLFARGTSRQREIALRAALGASRARLFSQFLTESLVLAVLGGALGIFFAVALIDAITAVMPPVGTMIPSEAEIRISVPVLLFTIAVTSLAGLLFGAAPAWQAARLDLNEVLKLGGRSGSGGGRRKALRVLVVAEFALALTLLACGGLALRGFWNLTRVDLGIQTDNALTFRLPVPAQRFNSPDQTRSYYNQMLERIQAVPGVKDAAAMTGMPGRWTILGTRFTILGQPPPNPTERRGSSFLMVTPDYFDALGIRVVSGRRLNEQDTETSQRVAMINEFFATRYLPGVDPIGQRISVEEFVPGGPRGKAIEWQIVGVYHNVRPAGFREDNPQITVPFAQHPWPQSWIVVKTVNDPKAAIKDITAAVSSVDPDLPLAGLQTVDEIVSESLAIDRFSVVLFASFGALGLLLAAVGIYGVMAFAVAQRTHEFGVRMALGAQRSRVINMVLKEGAVLAICGSAIGLGGAYLVGRAMQSTLFGVEALDVRAFGAVSVLLLVAALLACLFPAWRASRVEPLEALRYE